MRLRFRMAWARILLLFCFFGGAPLAPFCWVCLVACRLPSLSLRKGFLAGGILFSLSSSRSVHDVSRVFEVAVSHGLCTNPAAVLLFSGALPKHLFVGFVWWLARYQTFRCAKVSLLEAIFFSFF